MAIDLILHYSFTSNFKTNIIILLLCMLLTAVFIYVQLMYNKYDDVCYINQETFCSFYLWKHSSTELLNRVQQVKLKIKQYNDCRFDQKNPYQATHTAMSFSGVFKPTGWSNTVKEREKEFVWIAQSRRIQWWIYFHKAGSSVVMGHLSQGIIHLCSSVVFHSKPTST